MSNESRTLNIPSDATAQQMREVYDKYKSVLDEDFRSRESNWNEEAMGKDWPKNGLFDDLHIDFYHFDRDLLFHISGN